MWTHSIAKDESIEELRRINRQLAEQLAIKERACEILKKLSPRLQSALRDEGIHCGKNRIKRLMKSAGIIDTCSRKIVGYVFGNDLSTSLVIKHETPRPI